MFYAVCCVSILCSNTVFCCCVVFYYVQCLALRYDKLNCIPVSRCVVPCFVLCFYISCCTKIRSVVFQCLMLSSNVSRCAVTCVVASPLNYVAYYVVVRCVAPCCESPVVQYTVLYSRHYTDREGVSTNFWCLCYSYVILCSSMIPCLPQPASASAQNCC